MRLFTGISLPACRQGSSARADGPPPPARPLAWTPEAKLLHHHEVHWRVAGSPGSPNCSRCCRWRRQPGPLTSTSGGSPGCRLILHAGVEISGDLAAQTEDLLQGLGILKEKRRYQPHVTLGRIRRKGDPIDKLNAAASSPPLTSTSPLPRHRLPSILIRRRHLH